MLYCKSRVRNLIRFCPVGIPIIYLKRFVTPTFMLFLTALVASCSQTEMGPYPPGTMRKALYPKISRNKVGILLPLSGSNSDLGQNMLDAAKLALSQPISPRLTVYDTSVVSAEDQARRAIADGNNILLGPLTSTETDRVASISIPAGIPVLAFTSDSTKEQPGVWVMGITPQQQVYHLVQAAKREGRSRFAAFLPDTPFGYAMGKALTQACLEAGLLSPSITYHGPGTDDIMTSFAILSQIDSRKQVSMPNTAPQLNPKSTSPTDDIASDNILNNSLISELLPGGNKIEPSDNISSQQNTASANVPLPLPPFDALLLADTGLELQTTINAMSNTQVNSNQVRIMGPALWAAFTGKLGALAGAWYAAPDTTLRQEFIASYTNQYKITPKFLSDLSYDTAALVNELSTHGIIQLSDLIRPGGYNGVDGIFILQPNGQVIRDLSIYQIQPGGNIQQLPKYS